MGFHVCWVAIRGKPAPAVYASFRLQPTSEVEEYPESPLVGAALPNGWTVVFANDPEELPILEPAPLAEHSIGCELVACLVEEGAMVSAAVEFRDGNEVWWASHDSSKNLENLAERGTFPPQYASIKEDHFLKQRAPGAGADYVFDVPVELARSIVGFRHDEDNGTAFTVLEMHG